MATKLYQFTFNPITENTYLLIDDKTLEAAIIDPGCCNEKEYNTLNEVINKEHAKPVLLLATHLHFDHIWGIPYVASKYKLTPKALQKEIDFMPSFSKQMEQFMIPPQASYNDATFDAFSVGDTLHYGNCSLEVLFTPGHTPGHVTFYNKSENFALCGDVVFKGNVGRCDLPGGNYDTMMQTLKEVFVPMPNETVIFSGHGPSTTIKDEKQNNPYIKSQL